MKTMNFKHLNLIMVIAFCLFIFGPIGTALAEEGDEEIVEVDEQDEPEAEVEEPAFQNPTQVQRAINLAEAYAEKPDPELEKALDDVDKTQEDLDKAQEELGKLDPDDPENKDKIAQLNDDITGLELALKNAQDDVESRMADNAGVTSEDIEAMREEGMGWGQIAHELGLHPGLLGMGHTKRNRDKTGLGKGFNSDEEISDTEIEEATARNFKSGFSKGHGISADKDNQGKSSEKGDKGKNNSGNNNGNNGNNGGKKK
ncbi:hypothetical protein KAJ27_14375 [bacterium]|nr:hypothetical protein [bacterium]